MSSRLWRCNGKAHALEAALLTLGFAPEFEIHNLTDFRVAHDVWKDRVVAARRSGNISLETALNSAFAVIKPHGSKYCPVCGSRKGRTNGRCYLCHRRRLTYGDNIMAKDFTEYQIEETPVIVPHALKGGYSALGEALQKLCAGQVGDSFVARRAPSAVALSAKMLGLKIICRCITPHEKDYKKRAFRIWRSDGHDMDELNRLIHKRLNGETVTTQPLDPPDAETVRGLKERKHPPQTAKTPAKRAS
jgi:hypothetical protein